MTLEFKKCKIELVDSPAIRDCTDHATPHILEACSSTFWHYGLLWAHEIWLIF